MDKLMIMAPYLPLALAVLFGISQLLFQVFLNREQRQWLTYIALIEAAALIFACSAVFALRGQVQDPAILAHYAFFTPVSLFFYMLFSISTLVTILSSSLYLEQENLQAGEFYALLFFALSGMMLLASGQDLMTLFIGLEIMSMSIYILVGYRRNDERSNEGAFKYFLLGSLASAIMLYGMALTYGTAGSLQIQTLKTYYAQQALGPLAGMGLLMLICGMAFKVAAVPFHTWTPDAYEGAPMPITGFMATAVKAAGFVLLLKVLGDSFVLLRSYWLEIVMTLAALTMLVGNVLAVVQNNFKRMMAYSSIVHTGYLLMGVAALNPSNPEPRAALMYYLLIYVMSTLGVFMALTHLSQRGEKYQNIADYAGLSKEHPFTAFALALFMFSFIGIPPLGGFFAKYYLFSQSMEQGLGLLVAFAIFNSLLSIYYYLRVVAVMYFQPVNEVWQRAQVRPVSVTLVLTLTVLVTVWSGIGPFNLFWSIPGLVPLVKWLQAAAMTAL